ncbi:hypothetical protein E3P77_00512 [Wallemia ichthyophaga]|nr:hypothetical protein E3P77_00512 [Wallemia ichthyophaga]
MNFVNRAIENLVSSFYNGRRDIGGIGSGRGGSTASTGSTGSPGSRPSDNSIRSSRRSSVSHSNTKDIVEISSSSEVSEVDSESGGDRRIYIDSDSDTDDLSSGSSRNSDSDSNSDKESPRHTHRRKIIVIPSDSEANSDSDGANSATTSSDLEDANESSNHAQTHTHTLPPPSPLKSIRHVPLGRRTPAPSRMFGLDGDEATYTNHENHTQTAYKESEREAREKYLTLARLSMQPEPRRFAERKRMYEEVEQIEKTEIPSTLAPPAPRKQILESLAAQRASKQKKRRLGSELKGLSEHKEQKQLTQPTQPSQLQTIQDLRQDLLAKFKDRLTKTRQSTLSTQAQRRTFNEHVFILERIPNTKPSLRYPFNADKLWIHFARLNYQLRWSNRRAKKADKASNPGKPQKTLPPVLKRNLNK